MSNEPKWRNDEARKASLAFQQSPSHANMRAVIIAQYDLLKCSLSEVMDHGCVFRQCVIQAKQMGDKEAVALAEESLSIVSSVLVQRYESEDHSELSFEDCQFIEGMAEMVKLTDEIVALKDKCLVELGQVVKTPSQPSHAMPQSISNRMRPSLN